MEDIGENCTIRRFRVLNFVKFRSMVIKLKGLRWYWLLAHKAATGMFGICYVGNVKGLSRGNSLNLV